MKLLLLALLAQAGILKVPFSAPAHYWPRLGPAVTTAGKASLSCAALSHLDPMKLGHAPSFDPLVKALAKLGQTPDSFKALSDEGRTALVAEAAKLAEKAVQAELGEPDADLAGLVVTRRMYLDENGRKKADERYSQALSRDGEGTLAKAKAAAEDWLSSGKLAAGESATVLAFDPYRKSKKKEAELSKPKGTTGDPKLDLFMMMHGVEPTGKGKPPAPIIDPLLDPFERAQQAAASMMKGKRVFFAEAWSPYYSGRDEKWRFVFYGLDDKKDKTGWRIDVRFENGKAKAEAAPSDVDPRHIPFSMDRYLMAKGTGFGVESAEAWLEDLLPKNQIGLTVSLGMRDDGDGIDPYFVFRDADGELGGMNGRTGETFRVKRAIPGAPAEQPKSGLARLWDWLRSL